MARGTWLGCINNQICSHGVMGGSTASPVAIPTSLEDESMRFFLSFGGRFSGFFGVHLGEMKRVFVVRSQVGWLW